MKLRAFVAGLGLGALFAILFAPQSGEETRGMISEKVDQGKQFVNDKVEEATFKVAAAADEAVERIVIQRVVNESDATEPETVDFPGPDIKAS